jgi:ATP-dependent Clp protease ATP-binding subunit ClpA
MGAFLQQLDPSQRSRDTQLFEAELRAKIVGQEEAIAAMVDFYQVFRAGLNSPGRPVANLLLLGPTGSGKTHIVEVGAQILFGDARAVLKVDCAEFQHSHEISKLLGSPPGYLGHRETHPVITQERLTQYHMPDLKLSFVLFDEIEKASDALWQLLLGILDKATLTLGDNRRVDLSQCAIFMTSNLGGSEISELMTGGVGFVQPRDKREDSLDEKVKRTAMESARKRFSPEFINRLDKLVVFHPLRKGQLERVLLIELEHVQKRIVDAAKTHFVFRLTPEAGEFLLRDGTNIQYGARHLKRAIELHLVSPLANLLATGQIQSGDMIVVDCDSTGCGFLFLREPGGALVPKGSPAAGVNAPAELGAHGRPAPAPPVAADSTARLAPPLTADPPKPAAAPRGRT